MRKFISLIALFTLFFAGTPDNPNTNFSTMEREHVKVATPGLFTKSNTFYLHLDSIPDDQWCYPLHNSKVISEYMRNGSNHAGTDIKAAAGDTIYCCFDGVVRMSKPYYAYGNLIVVRHPFGLETVYSHNLKNLVKSGDIVKVGEPIALVGRTGRATTNHLHFETRVNGEHFNSNIIFNHATKQLRKETIKCTKSGNNVIVKSMSKK